MTKEKTQKENDWQPVAEWIVQNVREIRRSLFICSLAACMFIGCMLGIFVGIIF